MPKRVGRVLLKMYKRTKRLEERVAALEKYIEDQNAEALRRYWAKYPQDGKPDYLNNEGGK